MDSKTLSEDSAMLIRLAEHVAETLENEREEFGLSNQDVASLRTSISLAVYVREMYLTTVNAIGRSPDASRLLPTSPAIRNRAERALRRRLSGMMMRISAVIEECA